MPVNWQTSYQVLPRFYMTKNRYGRKVAAIIVKPNFKIGIQL
jgi:hypothetical protein